MLALQNRPAPDYAQDDEIDLRAIDYEAVQLHERTERCWGVIGFPFGAIAEDVRGKMLMRLTEAEARGIAASMSFRAIMELELVAIPT